LAFEEGFFEVLGVCLEFVQRAERMGEDELRLLDLG